MKVVIIGGVAAGAKTAARLSRIYPQAQISILEKGPDLSFANCGLPFYLGNEFENKNLLLGNALGMIRNADFFKETKNVTALTEHKVIEINRLEKTVTADTSQGQVKFNYDKLVLALGASPTRLDIPGKNLKNIFHLWTYQDTLAIENTLKDPQIKKALIIGAGLVGLEIAEAFIKRGLSVTIVDNLAHPLGKILSEELGLKLIKILNENGITFLGSETVTGFLGQETVAEVQTENTSIPAQIVISSVGVKANLKLAQKAGLKIGDFGIIVNDQMLTSDPDIYAAGDLVESKNIISHKNTWQALGSTANRQGRVVADNIAGLKSKFKGVLGSSIIRMFNWSFAKTGLSLKEALDNNFSVETMWTTNSDKPAFMPNAAPIFTKLLVNKTNHKIIGAQMGGPGQIDKRIDVIATAITGGLTIEDLTQLDTAYAPPFAQALDTEIMAGNALENKLNGLLNSCSPSEFQEKIKNNDTFAILDVRTIKEYKNQRIKTSNPTFHIPLNELRTRYQELPQDKTLIIVCQAAVRAWDAYCILKAFGFKNIVLLEGGLALWPYAVEN